MSSYLESVTKQFKYYKLLAEKAIEQLSEDELFWTYNSESNSVAIIVNHIAGNMLSRFTDFLSTDGEKEWRNRDAEFIIPPLSRDELIMKWNQAWKCLFNALEKLTYADLEREVFIRNDGHTVVEAINRQLAHYPYHIGQIIFIGKMLKNDAWQTLSIPRNQSSQFNDQKFSNKKERRHFTDDL